MVCLGGERVVDVGALFKRNQLHVHAAWFGLWRWFGCRVLWRYDALALIYGKHETKVGKEERRLMYEQATHPYEYEVGTPGSAALGGEFGCSGRLPLLLCPPVVEVLVVAEEACASLGAGNGWWRLG